MKYPQISLVAAVSQDGVIGRNGSLPWEHIPADMKRFRSLTMGKPVIMGRKTYESIGGPLEGRINIVVSSHSERGIKGCAMTPNLHAALCEAKKVNEEAMVIGGSTIYYQVFNMNIPFLLYLTVVGIDVPDGDAHFPWIDRRYMIVRKSVAIEPGPSSPRYGLQFVDAIFNPKHKAEESKSMDLFQA